MKKLGSVLVNFTGTLVLIGLLALPFYFSSQVIKHSNVAGARNTSHYILISQIDKFPGLELSQQANDYKITLSKISASQAFIAVALVSNPTDKAQNYELLSNSEGSKVFFGEDLNNLQTIISAPSSASIPISILASGAQDVQTVEFTIKVN